MPGGPEERLLAGGLHDPDQLWVVFHPVGDRMHVRRAEDLCERDLAVVGELLVADAQHAIPVEGVEQQLRFGAGEWSREVHS